MEENDQNTQRPHVVIVVSDGTGVTGERVVQAALTQFDPDVVAVERIGQVRSMERITEAIVDAAGRNATILFSFVVPDQRRHLLHEARRHHVAVIDLLGPILQRLGEVLAVSPRANPGIFRQLDEEYFRRIDAIDFAVRHDDGKAADELSAADIVLVGVSRTSKTPLSMFLAYRGWRVANVPIVLGIEPPPELFSVDPAKVIALHARPVWLEGVRRERQQRLARGVAMSYATLDHIQAELSWFRQVLARGGWTQVEVTYKAIEETAAEIVTLMRG
jgi:[pyruvate, water dikinase]-phosphate phosphotransferase / [pyruvate, water dikinase] kinase